MVKPYMLAAAAALTLCAGSALAQSAPTAAASGYYGYTSGYLFPDEGSPSGDQSTARVVTPPQGPGILSRIYLFPPSEGSDDNGGNS